MKYAVLEITFYTFWREKQMYISNWEEKVRCGKYVLLQLSYKLLEEK